MKSMTRFALLALIGSMVLSFTSLAKADGSQNLSKAQCSILKARLAEAERQRQIFSSRQADPDAVEPMISRAVEGEIQKTKESIQLKQQLRTGGCLILGVL